MCAPQRPPAWSQARTHILQNIHLAADTDDVDNALEIATQSPMLPTADPEPPAPELSQREMRQAYTFPFLVIAIHVLLPGEWTYVPHFSENATLLLPCGPVTVRLWILELLVRLRDGMNVQGEEFLKCCRVWAGRLLLQAQIRREEERRV